MSSEGAHGTWRCLHTSEFIFDISTLVGCISKLSYLHSARLVILFLSFANKTVWTGIFCDISCILISEVGSNHSRGFPAGSGKVRVASHSKVSCARFLQGISVPPASSEESTHTLLRMLSFGAGLECWHYWFDKDQHVQAHQKHCVAHLTHTNVSSLNCENDDNEETLEDYVTAVQTKQTSTMK